MVSRAVETTVQEDLLVRDEVKDLDDVPLQSDSEHEVRIILLFVTFFSCSFF